MKKIILFFILIGSFVNGNIVAMDSCGTCGQGLTSFGKKIIEGVGQDGLLFAGSMATFSAGTAALSWLKSKWSGNLPDVKGSAKTGACVGAGFAAVVSLMRTVNTYPSMFLNVLSNHQDEVLMCTAPVCAGIGAFVLAPKYTKWRDRRAINTVLKNLIDQRDKDPLELDFDELVVKLPQRYQKICGLSRVEDKQEKSLLEQFVIAYNDDNKADINKAVKNINTFIKLNDF